MARTRAHERPLSRSPSPESQTPPIRRSTAGPSPGARSASFRGSDAVPFLVDPLPPEIRSERMSPDSVEEEMEARRAVTDELLRVPPGPAHETTEESHLRPYGITGFNRGRPQYWKREKDGDIVECDSEDDDIKFHQTDRNGFDSRHRRLQRHREGKAELDDPVESDPDPINFASRIVALLQWCWSVVIAWWSQVILWIGTCPETRRRMAADAKRRRLAVRAIHRAVHFAPRWSSPPPPAPAPGPNPSPDPPAPPAPPSPSPPAPPVPSPRPVARRASSSMLPPPPPARPPSVAAPPSESPSLSSSPPPPPHQPTPPPQLEGDDALVDQYLRGPLPPSRVEAVLPTQAAVDAEIAARRAVTDALLRMPTVNEDTLELQLRPYGILTAIDAPGPPQYWIRDADGVAVPQAWGIEIHRHRFLSSGFDSRHRRLQRARQGLEAVEDPLSQAQADADYEAFGQG